MSTDQPNILYLVHRTPYPPNRGDRIRSFHILKFLVKRARVHLAFLANEPPEAETMQVLEGMCDRVAAISLGRRARWLRAAWSLARGQTATEGAFCSGELHRLVRRWTEETRFDSVVVFCSSMVQYLDAPGLAGVPAIVDLVDVDSQKWFDYADSPRPSAGEGPGVRAVGDWLAPVSRFLFRLEGRRLRALERALPARAKAVTLVSQSEVNLFRSFCPADNIHAIPNGVDLDYFRPDLTFPDLPFPPFCLFTGALDYRANIDGLTWFCEQVWPEVHRRCPQATFVIVGSNPGRPVQRLAEIPGVRLIGPVPDVRPYLAHAALCIAPLRVARGIQNKVLEALAMAKPLVASPQACEGLDVLDNVHLRMASTAEQWIATTAALIADDAARASLGRAGRDFVEQRHHWEAQLAPLAPQLALQSPLPKNGEPTCRLLTA